MVLFFLSLSFYYVLVLVALVVIDEGRVEIKSLCFWHFSPGEARSMYFPTTKINSS